MSNLKRNTLAAIAVLAVALAIALKPAAPAVANPNDNGVVTVKSAYGFNDTVAKLKEDISKKGIKFFLAVDQSAKTRMAKCGPSTPTSRGSQNGTASRIERRNSRWRLTLSPPSPPASARNRSPYCPRTSGD